MNWKPIDTAPEETPILIFDGKMIATALYREYSSGNKFWTIHGASGYECENDFDEPTHWMPLPGPPKS